MRIFLETDRLLLRYAVEADAELLHDLDGDPEVMRYLTGGKPTPRSVIEGCQKRLKDYDDRVKAEHRNAATTGKRPPKKRNY